MGFKADPEDIHRFGTNVSGLSSDAAQARTYAQTWLDIGYADARMFATVVETATAVREILLPNYERLEDLVSTSGDELQSAADYYRETDQEVLERLDRTYPAPGN